RSRSSWSRVSTWRPRSSGRGTSVSCWGPRRGGAGGPREGRAWGAGRGGPGAGSPAAGAGWPYGTASRASTPAAARDETRSAGRVAARPRGRLPAQVWGALTLATVRAYAEAGADYIAIAALTHSPPAADISLEIDDA